MRTVEHYLCRDCEHDLKAAQLVYKRIPNTDGEQDACDFCKRKKITAKYRIRYGRQK